MDNSKQTKMNGEVSEKVEATPSILNEEDKLSLSNELVSFLDKCKVERGQDYTHTCFAENYKGSFYIPPDKEDHFYELYERCFKAKMLLGIIEKPRDIMPLLLDLDFKQSSAERRYCLYDITAFIETYDTIVRKYVDLGDTNTEFYILEKPQPRKDNDTYKDGVHIVCPNIVVRPQLQQIIRNELLKEWDTYSFGKKWSRTFLNSKEDIYDEAVLGRNGWFMYGSCKATEKHPWKVNWKAHCEPRSGLGASFTKFHSDDLVETLSIRNKYTESKLTEGTKDKIDAYIQEAKERQAFVSKNITTSVNTKPNYNNDDYTHSKDLVTLLSEQRADNYLSWLKVGFCLRNIDNRLLEDWIDFSKKSSKYKEGECERLWNSFADKADGLKMGSLHMWAKQDNPDGYEKYIKSQLLSSIRTAKSGTEYDVACVFAKMYPKEIVYDTDTGNWYRFNGVCWKQDPKAHSIKQQIPEELADEFRKAVSYYASRASANDIEPEEKDRLDDLVKSLNKVVTQLKRASFQKNIIEECELLYGRADFESKLNENRHLIGFENGVYDLDEGVFRKGEFDDLVSITTGYEYKSQSNPQVRQRITEFFDSIMPSTRMRNFLLMTTATCLHGNKKDHAIYFWIGSGGNGKGITNVLLAKTLGQYYYALPIEWYCNKKKNASSANPETLKMKGTRLMLSTEPEQDDMIYVGKLKQLTGGDQIEARALYGKFIAFESQGLNIIQTNEKPKLSGTDGGVKRRLRVIRFPYQFVETPKLKHERQINKDYADEFKDNVEYHQEFMLMLIECYAEYKQANYIIPIPDEVRRETDEYLDANNHLKLFIEDHYEEDADGIVAWEEFQQEFKREYPKVNKSKKDIKRELEDMGYEVKRCKARTQPHLRDRECVFGLKMKSSLWLGDETDDYN